MGTWKALVVEDAYLHDEDALSLEAVMVRVNDSTVDLTVCGRPLAITLELADWEAISQMVAEVQAALAAKSALRSWQPEWSEIDPKIKFIAKDESGKVYGYNARPNAAYTQWTCPWGVTGFRLHALDAQVPGDWRESLYERPE